MTEDARRRLREATTRVLVRDGIRGASARVIAAEAGVSQALVFYHYGTVTELLADVAETVSRQRAETYRQRLAATSTVSELIDVARELHLEEVESGNLGAVRQLIALAATEPELRPNLRRSFAQLTEPVETTLRRLLGGTVLEEALDVPRLASSVAGSFLGLQVLDGVVLDIGDDGLASLEQLARLSDLLIDAGVLESAVIRQRLRRASAPTNDQR